MKITLSEQIIEAELHRDDLQALIAMGAEGQGDLAPRLHRAEGVILTLRLIHAVESEFRQFMIARRSQP